MNAPIPNPGSIEALAMGCICAVIDNNHGRGSGPFWITEGCPVHNREAKGERREGSSDNP